MARRTITIDEKIEKAEAAVISAKAKYDAALDELEKLVTNARKWMTRKYWRLIMPAGRRQMKS